jgi:hypothetical protein
MKLIRSIFIVKYDLIVPIKAVHIVYKLFLLLTFLFVFDHSFY